jgi:hypothetical protein
MNRIVFHLSNLFRLHIFQAARVTFTPPFADFPARSSLRLHGPAVADSRPADGILPVSLQAFALRTSPTTLQRLTEPNHETGFPGFPGAPTPSLRPASELYLVPSRGFPLSLDPLLRSE